MRYPTLRSIHLLFGLVALPFLLMYGVTAVQMAHAEWFDIRPQITEWKAQLAPGLEGSGAVLSRLSLQGEIARVRTVDNQIQIRIQVPGVVHEIVYDRRNGTTRIKTSQSGVLGKLNRLHHAAGLWPDYVPLKLWGAAIGSVSIAVVGLAVTGVWMWWLRRQDRLLGLMLVSANVTFAAVVLTLIRMQGP